LGLLAFRKVFAPTEDGGLTSAQKGMEIFVEMWKEI
jgi:hypothetical protein